MIQKITTQQSVHKYEILDHLITPSQSLINTDVYVDGTTVVEMTLQLNNIVYAHPRLFSSNDTNTDTPGWHEPGTWGLHFEGGVALSIKMLGADYSTLSDAVIVRTGISFNDLMNMKLRYNLTATGYLNIYDMSDNVYKSFDASQNTDPTVVSSSTIKLFNRFATHETIQNNSYVYDCKIWQNNDLIRHYVPVKRLSDNVVGMYDLLNDNFYVNEKSGYLFSGVSKSVPEYIDETTEQTVYVNDIVKYGLKRKNYEILDEIHATQSFTYIDTGVYCTSDISVEVKYKSETSHNSGYPPVFAGNAEWNDSQAFHVYYHLGELAYKFIGETDNHYTGIYTDTNEHIIHMSSTEITFDGTVLGTQQDPHISGSKNLLLLAKRPTQPNEQGFFPIYYFKVWNGNTLIRDLIPVKRLSDDAIGMYDRVNNVFYGSATSNSFSYTSLQTPEYITEFDNTEYHINRIYLNGELYWGGDTSSSPQPTERYIPALYCMNNNSSSTNQEDHATFTIPWAPDPSIAHSIDVELVPVAQTSQYYGWSLFFGGNTSTMSHMGNIYGFYSQYTTKICADALNKSMETSSYDINNYLNMLWKIQISNAAEVGGQRNCAAIVKAGNDTLLSATSVSTRSNWGTFDPYFIFGSQIEHHTTSFGTWQFKLYKFDIYDDNVLVYQLRPYYDTVNQEYGMYDLVNNIFYPSMNAAHPFTGELQQS